MIWQCLAVLLNKNPFPETQIATEHGWFEDDRFPFGVTHFQGRTINFRECSPMIHYITKKILPLNSGVVSPRTFVFHIHSRFHTLVGSMRLAYLPPFTI